MIHVLGAARAMWLRDVKAKAREMRLKRARTDHVGLVDTGKGNLQRALTVEGHYPFSIFFYSGFFFFYSFIWLNQDLVAACGI